MRKVREKIEKQKVLLSIIIVGILLITVGLFYSSFSLPEPVRSISFASSNLNYDEKAPGSWKIEKSAEWIDRGKARITIDVDTVLKEKEDGTDLILVLDSSESMRGEKLEKEKEASIKLVEKILLNSNNRIGLIEYDSTSTILSNFTNDKNILINRINNLEPKGSPNYFSALTGIDNILKSRNDNRPFEIIIASGSYPTISNSITVNSQNTYNYLKQQYPNIIINTVQYSQGNEIIEQIKRVSDIQYIANTNSLEQVLLNIPINSTSYDEFTLTEYIDTSNFYIESTNDIKVSEGRISFDKKEQKVTWNINFSKSGLKPKMTIDVKLKEELLDVGGIYSTSKEMSLHTKLEENIEDVTNGDTPIIKDNYQITYEVNAPEGCSVSNVPENRNQFVFDKVDISTRPTCEGYQFKGWSILTEGVKQINDDYFIMPESDAVLRGEWTSLKIAKSMNGEIYVGPPSIIRKVELNDSEDIWKYKSVITKVVFENKMDDSHTGLEEFDISEEKNSSVMAYYDSTNKIAYIQGNKKIYANVDSSYLFYSFTSLKQIDGLEYFDTSSVTNMEGMFQSCSSLTNLNLSSFNTSNVINMVEMFRDCTNLVSLNLSDFNTSSVTNMNRMFVNLYNLKSLDVSHFDTSKVTDMTRMFPSCNSLTKLDLSNWDTSNVTSMRQMFAHCTSMTKLILTGKFNTSSVIDLSQMFYECSSLTSLDLSNFDTSNVTNMHTMFTNCNNLVTLDLSGFDTSNVENMGQMFQECYKLTTTITILNPNTTYNGMFWDTSISGGKVTVNYTAQTSSLVDRMIATKTSNGTSGRYSNVVKGTLVTI